jgi:hypothetical protein
VLGIEIPAGVLATVDAGAPLGPVGLAAGASLGAWVEWLLLRRALGAQLGGVSAGFGPLARMLVAALGAALAASLAARSFTGGAVLAAAVAAAAFGVTYLVVAVALRLEQATALLRAVARRV